MSDAIKKRLMWIGGVALLLLIGASSGFLLRKSQSPQTPSPSVPQKVPTSSAPKGTLQYTPAIPANVAPTKPAESVPVLNDKGKVVSQLGTFLITASQSGYAPSTLTVKSGDVVEIDLISQGGDFDLYSPSAGFYVATKQGETGTVSFKATLVGTYTFECRDLCPAKGSIKGSLIVTP